MGQSTREIKRRIRGISNTKQITKAMELVSSAKMRKAKIKLAETRPYYTTVLDSIGNVINNSNVNHPLLEVREVKKSLYIVISADRGLAGGYNANINRLVHDKYRNNTEDICLITIGSKARDFFRSRNYEVVGEFLGISENPDYADAKKIGKMAVDLYLQGEVDEINLVYTEFVSTISYKPSILKLLPAEKIGSKEDELDKKEKQTVMEFEPSPEEVLDFLIPKYVQSTIYGGLVESSCSEQAARRVAMESATENAGEMIDDLNMSYNRARQAAITMEISEIVSGAEALK